MSRTFIWAVPYRAVIACPCHPTLAFTLIYCKYNIYNEIKLELNIHISIDLFYFSSMCANILYLSFSRKILTFLKKHQFCNNSIYPYSSVNSDKLTRVIKFAEKYIRMLRQWAVGFNSQKLQLYFQLPEQKMLEKISFSRPFWF